MYSTYFRKRPKPRRPATATSAASATKRRRSITTSKRGLAKIAVVEGKENVFADLGLPPVQAQSLKIRADLMLDLRRHILDQGWTQAEAARSLGETQPRISNLMKGEIDRFSIDKLINLLARAGKRVRIAVEARAA